MPMFFKDFVTRTQEPEVITHPKAEDVVAGRMLYDLEKKMWFVVASCQTCARSNPALQEQLDSFVKDNLERFALEL